MIKLNEAIASNDGGHRGVGRVIAAFRRSAWSCLDCGGSTRIAGEYYMVRPEVWAEAMPSGKGMLCLGCLAQRLGRLLRQDDFLDCPLNNDPRVRRSDRLRALLGDLVWSPERWTCRPRSRPKKEQA